MNKDTVRRILIWGGTAIGLALMVWGLAKLAAAPTTSTGTGGTLTSVVDGADHMQGSSIAKVTMVEYSDFQCPACFAFEPTVEQLKQKYGGQVLFVYRHFPLPQHQNADLAARVSEAAANQGKFWEMHDKLFSTQSSWSVLSNSDALKYFKDLASSLNLNEAKMTTDIDASATKDRIQRDVTSGTASGVDSTPSFYINGKRITGMQTYGDLETALVAAINEAK